MKKILMAGVLITGLIMANPAVVLACSQQKTQCAKCEAKAQQCKISELKKKVKPLWIHKDVLSIKEDQLNKIKDIKHKAIKELIQLNADKEIVMVDLESAMRGDSIDVNSINKLIDTKYAAKNKTAKTYVKAIGDIQKVLTKEQRAQWGEISVKSKLSEEKCAKCASSDGKICPLTGKSLDGKGSPKGSMK
jgi:Spy/CpxP family protein refolding chaperone